MRKLIIVLLLVTALAAPPLSSTATAGNEYGDMWILYIVGGIITWVVVSVAVVDELRDTDLKQSIVDEAYAGSGEKLAALARQDRKQRKVEEIAELIVELDHNRDPAVTDREFVGQIALELGINKKSSAKN